ncbi:hypothetical protein H9657_10305 [Cellulomonas sp. Sa3CUA2]|uniref:Uncharacterized protein n=1 Tax=Cellulomonas avistercoris TaxID=2762242 RepID=A0ABR8QE04_9CELL|nr:hypothetical protein [Cellulomonas avistercoris]MBD7918664.1 hypothetical protein [Cellulomonas avistercoris]
MRDRAKRTRTVAVVVVAALVGSTLLGALAALGGGGRSTVQIPSQGPWTVLVAADLRTAATCAQDPAVADAYVSQEAPAAGGGITMASDARVDDVERVVQCLARVIDPALIEVVQASPAA